MSPSIHSLGPVQRAFKRAAPVALAIAGLAFGTAAQATDSPEGKPAPRPLIKGYLNADTGAFVAVPRRGVAPDADFVSQASVRVGGTYVVNFNITVKMSLAATAPIRCQVTANTTDSDFTSNTYYLDQKSQTAVRSGNTATCTVTIFYSWLLPDLASSSVSTTYSVIVSPESSTGVSRYHTGTLPVFAVPANGATTTRNVSVTL